MLPKKRTKIVCTVGPASATEGVLKEMMRSGMDVARLNFSHGNHEAHARLISAIRSSARAVHRSIGILQDLQGPRIRIGLLPKEGILLKNGSSLTIHTKLSSFAGADIPVTYPDLHNDLKEGATILIEDGKIELIVRRVTREKIHTEVVVGGLLQSHKGMNFPGTLLSIAPCTEKDGQDLAFGVEQAVDMVALSFVPDATFVQTMRKKLQELWKKQHGRNKNPPLVFAKIERRQAIENFSQIVKAADGILIARGDLGLEMPLEDVPILQKKIIDACLKVRKPVIVATQMLESMTHALRPTRAEANDVAGAVMDHTDAVMLSGETANGEHPVQVVETMRRIIEKAEASVYDDVPLRKISGRLHSVDMMMAQAARVAAEEVQARAIVLATDSQPLVQLISRNRPELPIIIITGHSIIAHQLSIVWGVTSIVVEKISTDIQDILAYLKKHTFLKTREKVIFLYTKKEGRESHIEQIDVKEVP